MNNKEKNETAVGYLGLPEDVASLVSFLCKKESHFITGKCPNRLAIRTEPLSHVLHPGVRTNGKLKFLKMAPCNLIRSKL